MDAHEALFAQLLAKYTADSGTDGLANTSAAGYVRHFVRQNDPSIGPDRTGNWPLILVEIIDNDASSFGHTRFDGVVRFHVFTSRDAGFTTLNAVNKAVNVLFDKASLAASTSPWTFGMSVRLRSFAAPASSHEMHYVHEHAVHGCQ